MTITNHYGHWVNSEKPITGVYGINQVNFEFIYDGICTICDDIPEESECMYDENGNELEAQEYDMCDIECDSSHSKLIGDWTTTDNKDEAWFEIAGEYYIPDKSGEWAAIENESTIQVVWSKFTARAALCSPCYPGQADAGSNGEFLHYALPDDMIWKGE